MTSTMLTMYRVDWCLPEQARNAYGLMRAAPSEDGRGVASDELEAWRWQRIMLTGNDAIPPPGVVYPPLPETEAGQ